MRVESHPRFRILRRIPGAHAGEDGARSGPETGEVIDVEDLETPIEGSEEDDDEDADEDRQNIRKIGTALGGHVVAAMLRLN